MNVWFVYILLCADATYYVGWTANLEQRIKIHNDGRGAAYTALRPVALIYNERFDSELAAIHRERQLKGWSHEKKSALISGDKELLRKLSQSR